MMTLAGLLLMSLVVMVRWPGTPAARTLHRWLVEAPVRGLAGMTRVHVIAASLFVVMIFAGGETLALFGPHAAFGIVWDLAVYLDFATAAATLGALAKGRTAALTLRAWCGELATRRGSSRQRQRQRRNPAARRAMRDSIDPDPRWAPALAFA